MNSFASNPGAGDCSAQLAEPVERAIILSPAAIEGMIESVSDSKREEYEEWKKHCVSPDLEDKCHNCGHETPLCSCERSSFRFSPGLTL